MNLKAYSIGSTLYLEGRNPINDTVRFMCFSKFGPDVNVLTGIMSGFETQGIPFAARAFLVKLGEDYTPTPEIDELKESNNVKQASEIFTRLAVEPGQAITALQDCSSEGYLSGNAMRI